MQPIFSFDPVEPESSQVLILGSMPGKASLNARQYYAHPRNAFWPIMAKLLDFDAQAAYERRIDTLARKGVGLWDVMKACIRHSSLDADIVEESVLSNDFIAWFRRHPDTRAVLCNGAKAFDSYRRRVLPALEPHFADLPVHRLPSTSPAHAGQTFEAKLKAWAIIRDYLGTHATE